MQAQIRLGRIFGIEIGLHYSWLIIAVLIATSLAGHFSEAHPNWEATTIWTTAIVTVFFFFAAIILHELSHAGVARLQASLYDRSHFLLLVV
jgi:Zn-dependent protease